MVVDLGLNYVNPLGSDSIVNLPVEKFWGMANFWAKILNFCFCSGIVVPIMLLLIQNNMCMIT